MRTGPGWVVRELGVELLPGGMGSKPLNYGISMSVRDLDAVRAATGAAPEAVSAMLLSVYDGTVLDLSPLGRGPAGETHEHDFADRPAGTYAGRYGLRAITINSGAAADGGAWSQSP